MPKHAALLALTAIAATSTPVDAAKKPSKHAVTKRPMLMKGTPPASNRSQEELEATAPDDSSQYTAWYATLSKRERATVARACRDDYSHSSSPICNGIGPLAIPPPPADEMLMKLPRQGNQPPPAAPSFTRADWFRMLTRAQKAYVRKHCAEPAISELCGGTPLVVAFDNERVAYSSSAGTFALRAGDPVSTDWPTATTPWLALDRDGNGAIDSGAELFGSGTVMPSGTAFAKHGFVALAVLDANHDGVIDVRDPQFASLLLWADTNGDRQSSPAELSPASAKLQSISLAYSVDMRCDARQNCEGERSTMTWRDERGTLRTGSIIDVHLRYRDE